MNDVCILHAAKSEFARSIPHKPTRHQYIRSVAELTDLRGRALRRWLRSEAFFNAMGRRVSIPLPGVKIFRGDMS